MNIAVTEPPKSKLDDSTKRLILEVIKTLQLDEKTIEDELHRKWYTFGAYDYARLLAEKIKSL